MNLNCALKIKKDALYHRVSFSLDVEKKLIYLDFYKKKGLILLNLHSSKTKTVTIKMSIVKF